MNTAENPQLTIPCVSGSYSIESEIKDKIERGLINEKLEPIKCKCGSVEFTDKTTEPWKEDHWDNMNYFNGISNDVPESMKDAYEDMNRQGVKDFKLFLNKLKEKGWF